MSSKVREALSEIIDLIDKWRTDGVMEHWQYSQLFDIADNALGEPLKNCEVGTVDEQYARWDKHCQSMENRCSECSLHKNYFDLTAECYAKWSQMPYEEVK